ncbi:hypothetical protein CEXT_539251 [Caerostris extrusa]|uniref:Uncharacterized protein n=1 Tax=Caerostris extrusa TaxID=172846 RepID=A0AAV4TNV2_CAEEX|nr:hypothetical protein CEXT_539251 [Caerostris extrusa]
MPGLFGSGTLPKRCHGPRFVGSVVSEDYERNSATVSLPRVDSELANNQASPTMGVKNIKFSAEIRVESVINSLTNTYP